MFDDLLLSLGACSGLSLDLNEIKFWTHDECSQTLHPFDYSDSIAFSMKRMVVVMFKIDRK